MATFRKTDSSPATKFAEITKSDSTVYDPTPSAIYVGGAGDIEITGDDDVDATFVGVLAGTILSVRPKKIKAATTATNLVALY